MDKFRAYRIHASKEGTRAGFEELAIDDLTPGEVVIKAAWSDINYKDALAATGKGRILRTSPLNGGIDVSGQVVSSSDPRFKEGDPVLVCGCGLSETIDGGYSEYVRVPAWSVVPLPDGLSLRDVMAIGTAGFTAAIAVQRMQDNGQVPETGPIVVTGATGGVGSFAIDMLAALGYEVLAYTGKVDQEPYLRELGASGLLNRKELEMGTKPLENAQWGGAVDSVGGETLAWLTRTTNVWGNIASVGLAGGFKLETTVMPFILRGVSLLGINSVECPQYVRERAWSRLAGDLRPRHLDTITHREVSLDELPAVFGEYVDAAVTGRTVVRIGG
jgi:NADPH2:quinone reductase